LSLSFHSNSEIRNKESYDAPYSWAVTDWLVRPASPRHHCRNTDCLFFPSDPGNDQNEQITGVGPKLSGLSRNPDYPIRITKRLMHVKLSLLTMVITSYWQFSETENSSTMQKWTGRPPTGNVYEWCRSSSLSKSFSIWCERHEGLR